MKNWNSHQYSSNLLPTNSKSTKWQEQQISANPASTLGPSSVMMMELSNICFVLVFERGWPGLHSSTLSLSVHPGRGGRPWIELSENDKSVPLGPVFQLNMQNKMQISSYLRSLSKSAGLGLTVHWSNRKCRNTPSMKRL